MMKHIVALAFALLLLVAEPNAAIAQVETVDVTPDSPIEAILVAFDEESGVVYQRDVDEYGKLLDRTAAKCPEDRQTVGHIAIEAHRILKHEGFPVHTRTVLAGIDETFGDEAEVVKYGPTCADLTRETVLSILEEE